jgi:transketolase
MDEESVEPSMSHFECPSPLELDELEVTLKKMKKRILEIAGHKGGHFGGAFSCIDIILFLYKFVMNIDNSDPNSSLRDRFILSKGHSVLALYAVLEELGLLKENELDQYLHFQSRLAGHAEHFHIPWIEMSTGSLGHGANSGCGIALAAKLKGLPWKVFILVGDGELNEGSNWEALLFAAQHNLSNLILLIDNNGMESLDKTSEILGIEPLDVKLRAFGMSVYSCNGHNFNEISKAFDEISKQLDNKPKAIVFNTKKGNGVSFMCNNPVWHFRELKEDEKRLAIRELNA